MTAEQFNKLLATRIYAIHKTLGMKADEYATNDRLHNFKLAAVEFGGTPAAVCWSYMMKHLISIRDIATGVRTASPEVVHEKIGDAVNYLILMEAILLEPIITEKDDALASGG